MLVKARLPEGVAGIVRMHAMIGGQLGKDFEDAADLVKVGIEIDQGLWVQALVAVGCKVFGVDPCQAARYRERLGISGAKSGPADPHMLADMVCTSAHQLWTVAAGGVEAAAVNVVARLCKTLRTRTA